MSGLLDLTTSSLSCAWVAVAVERARTADIYLTDATACVAPCLTLTPHREVETDEFSFNFTITEKPHVQNDTVTLHKRFAQVRQAERRGGVGGQLGASVAHWVAGVRGHPVCPPYTRVERCPGPQDEAGHLVRAGAEHQALSGEGAKQRAQTC